jgi:hypothetical protein
MARDGQRVLTVVIAVHVRDLQRGFADRRFERHDSTLPDPRPPGARKKLQQTGAV